MQMQQGTKREADKTDVKDLEEDAKVYIYTFSVSVSYADKLFMQKMKLQSKHRVQRIRKANSRYWLQVSKKVCYIVFCFLL